MKERVETINKKLEQRDAHFYVEYQRVWRNNEEREGYVLRSTDPAKNACPILYHGEWLNKTDDELCDWLCGMYSQYALAVNTKAITDCENILEKVLPRVVSAETNAEALQRADICYREVAGGELLATYYLPITLANGQDASIPLTNALLDLAGISADEAYDAAVANMAATVEIVSMGELLAEMLGFPPAEETVEIPDLTVLTNKERINGAAAILCPEIHDQLKERFGKQNQKEELTDEKCLIVLPSSVHEVLVTAVDENADLSDYKNMVREVNDSQFETNPEDKLSYAVFGWRNGTLCAIA